MSKLFLNNCFLNLEKDAESMMKTFNPPLSLQLKDMTTSLQPQHEAQGRIPCQFLSQSTGSGTQMNTKDAKWLLKLIPYFP